MAKKKAKKKGNNGDEIESLDQLRAFMNDLPNDGDEKWVFRGDYADDEGNSILETTLEKAFALNGNLGKKHKLAAEKDIIREFQRKLHLYSDNLPARADIIQLLSLMQHHGAPTRMLDWTYSFWVAVHFATARCKQGKKAALWAVNVDKIVKKQNKFRQRPEVSYIWKKMKQRKDLSYCDPDAIKDNAEVHHLIKKPKRMVCVSSAFRMNQRLTFQQGTFLIAGDITKSFEDNLYAKGYPKDKSHVQMRIIDVNPTLQKNLAIYLRKVNINNAVLFPGLDGFSESLWRRVGLELKDKVLVDTKELSPYP